MSRPRRWRVGGKLLVALALVLGVSGSLGWFGARTWRGFHLQEVTGRADPPDVSCRYCHRPVREPERKTRSASAGYVSPSALAVAPDGRALYVVAEGTEELLEIDPESGAILRRVAAPGSPRDVAVSGDGRVVAVGSRDRDEVLLFSAGDLTPRGRLRAGEEPQGIALSFDGSVAWVAEGRTRSVAMLPVDGMAGAVRLAAGREPYEVALSADGRLLAVANRKASVAGPTAVPEAEITLVDVTRRRVRARYRLESAHLSEGVAIASDGSFVLAPALRVRNLLPTTQVARGALLTSVLALAPTGPGARAAQFPLDEVNAFFADPSGVVLTPDDRLAFVAHGGARTVSVIDVEVLRRLAATATPGELDRLADDLAASRDYVVARIPTRENPRALALSPDGRWLYVAERLADSVAVVDTAKLRVERRLELGKGPPLTARRRGERLFHDASVAFQGQFSCRSCHPDGESDELSWDFEIDGVGQHRVDTRSLRGVKETAPFKWNGKNPDLETQCGPRFARVLTRSDPFPDDEVEDLAAYIESLPLPPRRQPAATAAARRRGRELFFRDTTRDGREIPLAQRCPTCHRPPLYTDRLKADVGTGGPFDTPHLLAVGSAPPFLHDGRAATLEEIWTVFNPDDTHGVTSDMNKRDLNDLILFLRSL